MKQNKLLSYLRIALFILVIAVGCVVGFIIPLRPTISENEGRKLTEFPAFTVESFLSGDYTSKINLWYSDTFPARDALMEGNSILKSAYGVKTEDFKGKGEKDEIDLEQTFVWEEDPTESEGESETEPVEKEAIDGYYVKGDTAYQLYYFDKDYVDRYTRSVVNAAIKLDGIAQVYDIVVPTSPCIYLSDEEIEYLDCSDGNEAIEYIYKALDAYSDQLIAENKLTTPIKTIDVYPTLYEHKDEYIFFRTDHHWTGLGAYYTSRRFLDEVGRDYPPLSAYKEYQIDGFLGTLYKNTQNANLKKSPDTVYAYESPTVTKFKVLAKNATALKVKPIINPNVTSWNKYVCFINGDMPYSVIHNETINDESAILIIKDSFGNAFSPMLADSYEYVHIIDYRHWSGDLATFVQDNNVDTVLLLINSKAPTSNTSMTNLEKFLNQE